MATTAAHFHLRHPRTSNPQSASNTGNSLASALLGIPDNGRFQSEVNAVRTISPRPNSRILKVSSPAYFERRHTLGWGILTTSAEWNNSGRGRSGDGQLDCFGWKLPPPCNAASGVPAPCIPSTTPENNAVIAAYVLWLRIEPGSRSCLQRLGASFGFASRLIHRLSSEAESA